MTAVIRAPTIIRMTVVDDLLDSFFFDNSVNTNRATLTQEAAKK